MYVQDLARSATPSVSRTARRFGASRVRGAPWASMRSRAAAALRGRSGFTFVEVLGAVILISILVAMAVPATFQALKVHEAEAALKHDLHNAANAWEEAYVEDRAYPSYGELSARGFRLSPDVALDSTAVAGERVYLRLRHVPTGARCVLDYSRSSRAARNRADCYAGGLPRDTALTLRPEDPEPPASDTFAVAPPAPPDSPPDPLALDDPEVSSPSAQTAPPGSAMSQVFTVTNRSGVTRTFRFETESSDGSVASAPPPPAPATLAPNVPTAVEVRYTIVEGATADRVTVIALTAVDADDERWRGAGGFTAGADLVLADPAVSTPSDLVLDAGQRADVTWEVSNRSNAARTITLGLRSSDPAQVSFPAGADPGRLVLAAGETRQVVTSLLLTPSSDGGTRTSVRLTATDAQAPEHAGTAGFVVETRTLILPPTVGAPADRGVDPASSFTLQWSVTNTSNLARSFDIVASAAGDVAVASVQGGGRRMLARGETATVAVTYTAAAGSLAGAASTGVLRVADSDAPGAASAASVTLTTNEVVRDPVLRPVPPPPDWRLDEERTFTYDWTNASNSRRSFCVQVDAGTGVLAALTPTPVCGIAADAGAAQSLAHAMRAVGGGDQTATVTVYDERDPSHRAAISFPNRVLSTRPVAQWTYGPRPAYLRKWASFDASASYSPTGRAIVRYTWDWGDMSAVAAEVQPGPTAQHGFDARGRFYVCLTVTDSGGEVSAPACQWVDVIYETRARFSFRYRGWFTSVSWWSCIDVWWSDQCPEGSHGNARWEIDPSASQGDVPIRRVWAQEWVFYKNTDDPDKSPTYTYFGNYGALYDPARPYDFFANTDATGGPSADGRWRVLDSQGGFPDRAAATHPLVLTTDLGNATGILDSGPHLKPGLIVMQLWVEDADGRVTTTTRRFDHSATPWEGDCHGSLVLGICTGQSYTEVAWQAPPPAVTVSKVRQANGRYTISATAESEDGRVVALGYTWVRTTQKGTQEGTGTGSSIVNAWADKCETLEVDFWARDDLGRVGWAGTILEGAACDPGTAL